MLFYRGASDRTECHQKQRGRHSTLAGWQTLYPQQLHTTKSWGWNQYGKLFRLRHHSEHRRREYWQWYFVVRPFWRSWSILLEQYWGCKWGRWSLWGRL